jgi:hypothetical protein
MFDVLISIKRKKEDFGMNSFFFEINFPSLKSEALSNVRVEAVVETATERLNACRGFGSQLETAQKPYKSRSENTQKL